jgi:hypothetical protein
MVGSCTKYGKSLFKPISDYGESDPVAGGELAEVSASSGVIVAPSCVGLAHIVEIATGFYR